MSATIELCSLSFHGFPVHAHPVSTSCFLNIVSSILPTRLMHLCTVEYLSTHVLGTLECSDGGEGRARYVN